MVTEATGFPAEYHSDVDGDRYVIVDAEDYDLVGWAVEVVQDEEWEKRSFGSAWTPEWVPRTARYEFTRSQAWYRSAKGSPWGHIRYSKDEPEYPWSAMVDHGWSIARWIPPES
jgi:hypothetical protein